MSTELRELLEPREYRFNPFTEGEIIHESPEGTLACIHLPDIGDAFFSAGFTTFEQHASNTAREIAMLARHRFYITPFILPVRTLEERDAVPTISFPAEGTLMRPAHMVDQFGRLSPFVQDIINGVKPESEEFRALAKLGIMSVSLDKYYLLKPKLLEIHPPDSDRAATLDTEKSETKRNEFFGNTTYGYWKVYDSPGEAGGLLFTKFDKPYLEQTYFTLNDRSQARYRT